jgi:hypothetical protein
MNVSPTLSGHTPTSGFTQNATIGTHQRTQAVPHYRFGEFLQVKTCPRWFGDTPGHIRLPHAQTCPWVGGSSNRPLPGRRAAGDPVWWFEA